MISSGLNTTSNTSVLDLAAGLDRAACDTAGIATATATPSARAAAAPARKILRMVLLLPAARGRPFARSGYYPDSPNHANHASAGLSMPRRGRRAQAAYVYAGQQLGPRQKSTPLSAPRDLGQPIIRPFPAGGQIGLGIFAPALFHISIVPGGGSAFRSACR